MRCESRGFRGLTAARIPCIITAGRDDALSGAFPSDMEIAADQSALDGGFAFTYFLFFELRPNWIAFSTREAIIMTTEMISKSDMLSPPLLLLSVRGE